jgi:hypothetical protein
MGNIDFGARSSSIYPEYFSDAGRPVQVDLHFSSSQNLAGVIPLKNAQGQQVATLEITSNGTYSISNISTGQTYQSLAQALQFYGRAHNKSEFKAITAYELRARAGVAGSTQDSDEIASSILLLQNYSVKGIYYQWDNGQSVKVELETPKSTFTTQTPVTAEQNRALHVGLDKYSGYTL